VPQRLVPVLGAVAGLVGLLVVAGLLVLGRDPYRVAALGPRWRRRLIVAGLALLTTLGLGGCGLRGGDGGPGCGLPGGGGGPGGVAAAELGGAQEWRRLVSVLSEADEIAANKRGPYPFSEKGKKHLLARFADAEKDVDRLASAGTIGGAAAGLLKKDLAERRAVVQSFRPTEMKNATCYSPMPMVWPAKRSMGRLADRLPLLERLAAEQRLRPEVVRRVLVAVERDLATLDSQPEVAHLPAAERAEATKLRAAVRAALSRIRGRLDEKQ